jgi:hypothetical protein
MVSWRSQGKFKPSFKLESVAIVTIDFYACSSRQLELGQLCIFRQSFVLTVFGVPSESELRLLRPCCVMRPMSSRNLSYTQQKVLQTGKQRRNSRRSQHDVMKLLCVCVCVCGCASVRQMHSFCTFTSVYVFTARNKNFP